jgi:enamine deaminase RidA (YjgF/YER057c/UK114 family)
VLKKQLKAQKTKKMKLRNICILMQDILNLMTYLTDGKPMKRNSDTYQELSDTYFVCLSPAQAVKEILV